MIINTPFRCLALARVAITEGRHDTVCLSTPTGWDFMCRWKKSSTRRARRKIRTQPIPDQSNQEALTSWRKRNGSQRLCPSHGQSSGKGRAVRLELWRGVGFEREFRGHLWLAGSGFSRAGVSNHDVMVIISKEVRMLKLSEAGGKPPMAAARVMGATMMAGRSHVF